MPDPVLVVVRTSRGLGHAAAHTTASTSCFSTGCRSAALRKTRRLCRWPWPRRRRSRQRRPPVPCGGTRGDSRASLLVGPHFLSLVPRGRRPSDRGTRSRGAASATQPRSWAGSRTAGPRVVLSQPLRRGDGAGCRAPWCAGGSSINADARRHACENMRWRSPPAVGKVVWK